MPTLLRALQDTVIHYNNLLTLLEKINAFIKPILRVPGIQWFYFVAICSGKMTWLPL